VVPYETYRVAGVGGVEIATDLWARERPEGEASPGFLLVHGLASNARLYDGVAARLVAAGHGVATVDLRGHGRSGKPDDGYDYDTMCGDLQAVMAFLSDDPAAGFDRTVAVGQSYGGNFVMALAARSPAHLTGIACIDGGTIELHRAFPTWNEAASALAPPQIIGTPLAAVTEMFHELHPDWPEAGIEGSLANFEVRADGTVAPWLSLQRHMMILRAMWDHPPSSIFEAITVPVLLLPAESVAAPPSFVVSKRAGIENALATLVRAEAHWFSPADHDVHAQHPEEVAAVLLDWAKRSAS
jgi:pimeloyl-ACP methyl ester carboxylesterase